MSETIERPNVNYGDRETALANEILRTTVGSGVHGIAIAGTDDHDEMGVFIEPKANVYGMRPSLDCHVWRTQPEGARSGPGDTDLIVYSLRKYLAMAVKGNPTSLLPLFAPESDVLISRDLGHDLRALREHFLTQECVRRFIGYMHAQRDRMLGLSRKDVPNRPELIERYGWDVKYGSHALRLAYQGREVCDEGTLTLPMKQKERLRVLAVKTGKVPRDEVAAEIADLEQGVTRTLDNRLCFLPERPNWDVIGKFSVTAHDAHWNGTAAQGRRTR